MPSMEIVTGEDGVARCGWGASTPDYVEYHDGEWGMGVADDTRLFEKICLEGFQSGLSWLTILRKRENFRRAFRDFDPERVARFTVGRIHLEQTFEGRSRVLHVRELRQPSFTRRTQQLGTLFRVVRQLRQPLLVCQ